MAVEEGMSMADTLPLLFDVARRGEPFLLAGRHYVPVERLPAADQEVAALRWAVASMSAALERIKRLCAGDRNGIVSKGEIRDAF
jgi:hypothetical protein